MQPGQLFNRAKALKKMGGAAIRPKEVKMLAKPAAKALKSKMLKSVAPRAKAAPRSIKKALPALKKLKTRVPMRAKRIVGKIA